MLFRTTLSFILIFAFIINGPWVLKAENTKSGYPLGIVIRPPFFTHLVQQLNRREKPFSYNFCFYNDTFVEGHLTAKLGEPLWFSTPSNELLLETHLIQAVFTGSLRSGCQNPSPKSKPFTVTLHNALVQGSLDPNQMKIRISRNFLQETVKALDIQLSNTEQLTALLNQIPYKTALVESVVSAAEAKISEWFQERLRGLTLLQPVTEFLQDSPFWGRGEPVETGPMKLELRSKPSYQKIAFGFFPFSKNAGTVDNRALQFYLHASFFNLYDLMKTYGLNPKTEDEATLHQVAKAELPKIMVWQEAFQHPALDPSSSELSLVVPVTLINEALTTIYREGLLRFRSSIHIGKQTQGMLAKEAHDVLAIISIDPSTAPRISFRAEKMRAEIQDYSLSIGSYLEDRVIPTATLQTDAACYASIVVDNNARTINLKLEPDTFSLTLKEVKQRFQKNNDELSPQQVIDHWERMAYGLWKYFLKDTPSLVLFPSVIETTMLPLTITDIRINGEQLLLHVNVNWEDIAPQ